MPRMSQEYCREATFGWSTMGEVGEMGKTTTEGPYLHVVSLRLFFLKQEVFCLLFYVY